jgi:hypothetical protein
MSLLKAPAKYVDIRSFRINSESDIASEPKSFKLNNAYVYVSKWGASLTFFWTFFEW